MDRDTFHAFYGRAGAGILGYILNDRGVPRFWQGFEILPAGFRIDGLTVDYSAPGASGDTYPVTWQAPNLNLARRVSRPAEEQLVRAIRNPSVDWLSEERPSRALANRIAGVLIDHVIARAVPPEIDGRLVTVRLFPPSIRGVLARAIMGLSLPI